MGTKVKFSKFLLYCINYLKIYLNKSSKLCNLKPCIVFKFKHKRYFKIFKNLLEIKIK